MKTIFELDDHEGVQVFQRESDKMVVLGFWREDLVDDAGNRTRTTDAVEIEIGGIGDLKRLVNGAKNLLHDMAKTAGGTPA